MAKIRHFDEVFPPKKNTNGSPAKWGSNWIGKTGTNEWHSEGSCKVEHRYLNEYYAPDLTGDDEVKVAECPSGGGPRVYDFTGTCYVGNIGYGSGRLGSDTGTAATNGVLRLGQVHDPVRMVLLNESGAYVRWRDATLSGWKEDLYTHTPIGDDRWFLGFVDGHVGNLSRILYNQDVGDGYTFNNDL